MFQINIFPLLSYFYKMPEKRKALYVIRGDSNPASFGTNIGYIVQILK